MRQLTKDTTIEDIIFDLKDDGQNELAEWLQDNYIVNKAINEEAMCQDSYDEGYEVGYDDAMMKAVTILLKNLILNLMKKAISKA